MYHRQLLIVALLIIGKINASVLPSSAQCLPKTMKAVGFYKYLPTSKENSIVDLEVSLPYIEDNDVLVEVKAIAVNPIDTLIRSWKEESDTATITGRDGAGIIVAKGNRVERFNLGDEVYFLNEFGRNGTGAQYVATDESTVSLKPTHLTFEEAASLPLTATTAYNSLYNELSITEKDQGKTLLIINSGGGVGSIASQLGKISGLKVIGTASRPETNTFSRKYGVDIVLNHKYDLVSQLKEQGFGNGVDFILVNYDPTPYWNTIVATAKPQGKVCALKGGPVDIELALSKNIELACELSQESKERLGSGETLLEIAKLVNAGKLQPTISSVLSPINAANLREAHRTLEEQRAIGKIVLSGF